MLYYIGPGELLQGLAPPGGVGVLDLLPAESRGVSQACGAVPEKSSPSGFPAQPAFQVEE